MKILAPIAKQGWREAANGKICQWKSFIFGIFASDHIIFAS